VRSSLLNHLRDNDERRQTLFPLSDDDRLAIGRGEPPKSYLKDKDVKDSPFYIREKIEIGVLA
jgi:hypothetical protein